MVERETIAPPILSFRYLPEKKEPAAPASEEARCISLPRFPKEPRKLHIRSLLLPFQIRPASLGSDLVYGQIFSPLAGALSLIRSFATPSADHFASGSRRCLGREPTLPTRRAAPLGLPPPGEAVAVGD